VRVRAAVCLCVCGLQQLRSAVLKRKPLIAVLEAADHGGLTAEDVEDQLLTGFGGESVDKLYAKWEFDMNPDPCELAEKLFENDIIEWNRIGVMQDVTMRLIAQRLLPPKGAEETYVANEVVNHIKPIPEPPKCKYHMYCSDLVPGGRLLLDEVRKTPGFKGFKVTDQLEDLHHCCWFLVYLTGLTWTRGRASEHFADEVRTAMKAGVRLLLVHEMPGVGGQESRHGVEFGTFFSCSNGATPPELLRAGIYTQVAVPMKGGSWRQASMALFAEELQKSTSRRQPISVGLPSTEKQASYVMRRSLDMDANRASQPGQGESCSFYEYSCRPTIPGIGSSPTRESSSCAAHDVSMGASGKGFGDHLAKQDLQSMAATSRRHNLEEQGEAEGSCPPICMGGVLGAYKASRKMKASAEAVRRRETRDSPLTSTHRTVTLPRAEMPPAEVPPSGKNASVDRRVCGGSSAAAQLPHAATLPPPATSGAGFTLDSDTTKRRVLRI